MNETVNSAATKSVDTLITMPTLFSIVAILVVVLGAALVGYWIYTKNGKKEQIAEESNTRDNIIYEKLIAAIERQATASERLTQFLELTDRHNNEKFDVMIEKLDGIVSNVGALQTSMDRHAERCKIICQKE